MSTSPLLHSLLIYLEFDTLRAERQAQTPSVAMSPNVSHSQQFQQLEYHPPEGDEFEGAGQRDGVNEGDEDGVEIGDGGGGGRGGHGYPDSPEASVQSSDG